MANEIRKVYLNSVSFVKKYKRMMQEALFGSVKFGTSLHIAIKQRENFETIQQLLKEVKINTKDIEGNTALHIALSCSQENDEIVLELIRCGASVNEKNYVGKTPLHFAVQMDRSLSIVQELLKEGANVNEKDTKCNTPLFYTFQSSTSNLAIFKILLQNGAFVNETNAIGQTPLLIATQLKTSLSIIQELLKYGAEVNVKDSHDNTPLHFALNGTLINHNPFHSTKKRFDFIRKHSKVNNDGTSTLKDIEIIMELLNNGADVDVKNLKGVTPLHIAVKQGCLQIIQELLKYKPNINAKDYNDFTPLHIAVQNERLEVLRELFKHGVDVNVKNIFGSTPLHIATKGMIFQAIQEVLKHMTDFHEVFNMYVSLIEMKELSLHSFDMNTLPLDIFTPVNRPMFEQLSLEVIQELLKHGADINARDSQGDIPLYYALCCSKKCLRIIVELLKNGASVHSINDLYGTLEYIGNTRKKPKETKDLYRELLKYSLIEHSDVSNCAVCDTLIEISDNTFVDFQSEIDNMKHHYIIENVTLFDLVVLKNDYGTLFSKDNDILSETNNFQLQLFEKYPNYHDYIFNSLETKSYLRNKFSNIPVFIAIDEINLNFVNINSECLYEISKYLSKEDLRNFIRAYSI